METILARVRVVRHRIDPLAGVDISDGVREFKEVTEGMTTRLPFPGIGDMRKGSRVCVHALVIRFLAAARLAHLPRAWAERFIVFTQNQVDLLWGTEIPELAAARRKSVAAEAAENIAEMDAQAAQPDLEAEDAALAAEEEAVTAEVAADRVRLLAISRRRAQLARRTGR